MPGGDLPEAGGVTCLGDLLTSVSRQLSDAGIDNARLDARLLITKATANDAETLILYPEREVAADDVTRLDDMVRRRVAREPVSQILGERGFRDLVFEVTRDVLTPRPETETIVDAVLAHASRPIARILDLGTGSGCLILALLDELPDSTGVAVDVSPKALAVAGRNADTLGLGDRVTFLESNWFDALPAGAGADGAFDLIVANPPYIPDADIADLEPEVRDHEPRAALAGGPDGLGAYRDICAGSARRMRPGAAIVFEVGAGQAESVSCLLDDHGFTGIRTIDDFGGHGRVVLAYRSDAQKRVGNPGQPV